MDPANMLSRLRALKDASTRNQQYINSFTHTAPNHYYQQHPAPDNYSYFFNSGTDQADFNSRVLQDFQNRNQDLINAQLERDHANQLMTNILANMADYEDAELDDRLANINITELQQNNNISTGRDIIKTIHLAPVTKESAHKAETEDEDSGPDIADISEEEQERIADYIDNCYEHIIKVLKVYFILADGKKYRLPKPAEIRDMKQRLEGYIHVPDDVFRARALLSGTQIYYLTVDENSRVVLNQGIVHKLAQTGIIILDEIEKKKLDIGYNSPVFRKINNLDIATLLAG